MTRKNVLGALLAVVLVMSSSAVASAVTVWEGDINSGWHAKVEVTPAAAKQLAKMVAHGTKRAYDAAFTKHDTKQDSFDVAGKKVLVIPTDPKAGGTRLTSNFSTDGIWKGNSANVHIYLANVPDGVDPKKCEWAYKFDADWDEDETLQDGHIFHHSDHLTNFSLGHERYFAKRSDPIWGIVVIVEDGIPRDQLVAALKDRKLNIRFTD
jgi:hypothetical protein